MLKLIIVDDEKMPRDILLNYIPWESMGVDVVEEADDGINALNLALKIQPDIIISDVKMPRMDGIELATQVKTHLPQCKFIFLSGYSNKEYLKSAIKLQVVNYVEKPINLAEITEVLKVTVADCIKEKKKKEEALVLTEQQLCLDLLNRPIDLKNLKEGFSYIGKTFIPTCKYVTLVIKFNAEGQLDLRKHIINVLKSSLTPISSEYIMGLKEEDYCVLHARIRNSSFMDVLKEHIDLFIKEVNVSIREKSMLFIGIGQEVDLINNLYLSYQTAVISLQKHFFRGYNKYILYNEDPGSAYKFDESLLSLIDEYLKTGKKSETELLIKRLANAIRKYENTNPDQIKNIFYKIILSLSRFAEDRNISFFEDERKYILHILSKANTLDEIERNVMQLLTTIFYHLHNSNHNNKDIFLKITCYINANFNDENLSIHSISKNLNLTSTYLCMIFKRDTGKTINQYITLLRIEKAKEYLKTQHIKLYAIARIIGYNDGKYFTKVFTKSVGITPKEYRELHCYDKKNI